MTAQTDGIVPDDKDWTWVLTRACPECGCDVRTFPRERTGDLIRANAAAWQAALADAPVEVLRSRPSPDRWSPLEYAAHVRDVFRLYTFRLDLMLDEDGPHYPNWDQDATAVAERYGDEDPAAVTDALGRAAAALADRFDGVEGATWERTGYRSDGAVFTVESFARYLLHDPLHHLWDIGRTPAV
jgi:hypothetical protein